MKWTFHSKSYSRRLKSVFESTHAVFEERLGIIIRLENDLGQVRYGEIAPTKGFGTETFEEAQSICSSLTAIVADDLNKVLPAHACCTRAAFSQALFEFKAPTHQPICFSVQALLTLGEASWEIFASKKRQGYKHFKLKVGNTINLASAYITKIKDNLPEGGTLILDANGSIAITDLWAWLKFLEGCPVVYLEQPLPVGQEALMNQVSKDFSIGIALDESVKTIDFHNLTEPFAPNCYLVIKPSLIEDWKQFQKWHTFQSLGRCRYSSVFESSIGVENTLCFINELETHLCPVGYDTVSYFDDNLQLHQQGCKIQAYQLNAERKEALWSSLS
jgi:O-succinylbenzoate synthase